MVVQTGFIAEEEIPTEAVKVENMLGNPLIPPNVHSIPVQKLFRNKSTLKKKIPTQYTLDFTYNSQSSSIDQESPAVIEMATLQDPCITEE